jgi:hypothetical protein
LILRCLLDFRDHVGEVITGHCLELHLSREEPFPR